MRYSFDTEKAKHIWIGGDYNNAVVYMGQVGPFYVLYDLDAGEIQVSTRLKEIARSSEEPDYELALEKADLALREYPQYTEYADAAFDAISDFLDEATR